MRRSWRCFWRLRAQPETPGLLELQAAPKSENAPRGQLQERPESRVVQLARLAGVEPAARGFEGRTRHRPRASRNVPPCVIPHGYADATGQAGTNRTSGDAHPCHVRATALPGCVPTTQGEK